MTVFTGPMFNWRSSGLRWDSPPYESSSPNLVQLAEYMRETFGGCSMGIHFDKQTSNNVVSEHSWGAADDWGSGQTQVDWARSVGKPVGKVLTRAEHFAAVDWVVAHSRELHIQSIVDIGRSWRADRADNGALGWIPYASGYTGHAHIVTTLDGWDDHTPIADRLTPEEPMPAPVFFKTSKNSPTLWFTTDGITAVHVTEPQWVALGTPPPVVLPAAEAKRYAYVQAIQHDIAIG